MIRIFLAALILFTLSPRAFAWGREGHIVIGLIAWQRLHARSRANVERVLGAQTLADVANWADDLKLAARGTGPLSADPDAAHFNAAHPHNDQWHFVDLPLGSRSYAAARGFTSDHDVVRMTEQCIDTLRGHPAAKDPLSEREALMLLVHLVGDLHQPLHVGCGYFVTDQAGRPVLVTDPRRAQTAFSDLGGNRLYFSEARTDNLHAYWDIDLVTAVTRGQSDQTCAATLGASIHDRDAKAWDEPGDCRRWPELWAADTLPAARLAYHDLTLGPITLDSTKHVVERCAAARPPSYEADNLPRVQTQLEKAGYRLARLLDAIWPTS